MQSIIRPSLYGAGLTILWIVLGAANSSTTYHLAPLLVAGAVPVGAALADRITPAAAVAAAGVGIGLTYGATVILGATDSLTGPSLLPTGGAVLEAFVFGAVGTLGGLGYSLWSAR